MGFGRGINVLNPCSFSVSPLSISSLSPPIMRLLLIGFAAIAPWLQLVKAGPVDGWRQWTCLSDWPSEQDIYEKPPWWEPHHLPFAELQKFPFDFSPGGVRILLSRASFIHKLTCRSAYHGHHSRRSVECFVPRGPRYCPQAEPGLLHGDMAMLPLHVANGREARGSTRVAERD